jgi:ketosteroid isomerase-like protein
MKSTQQQQPAPDTRAADEAAIRQSDVAWSKFAEARQLDGHIGYFLEDAVLLTANEPIMAGKEAIRKMVVDMYAMPGFAVKWQPNSP